jgi:hypothetical protein
MKPGDLVVQPKRKIRWGNALDGVGLILREIQDPNWMNFVASTGASSPTLFEALFNGQVVEVYEYELELINETR